MGIEPGEASRRSEPDRHGGRQGARGGLDISRTVGLRGAGDVDPAALWRVPLACRDRGELDRAFDRDPELRVDTGLALAGLVELGVQGVFVREFVSRLRAAGPRIPPALSVLPAAAVAIEAVAWRP